MAAGSGISVDILLVFFVVGPQNLLSLFQMRHNFNSFSKLKATKSSAHHLCDDLAMITW